MESLSESLVQAANRDLEAKCQHIDKEVPVKGAQGLPVGVPEGSI